MKVSGQVLPTLRRYSAAMRWASESSFAGSRRVTPAPIARIQPRAAQRAEALVKAKPWPDASP